MYIISLYNIIGDIYTLNVPSLFTKNCIYKIFVSEQTRETSFLYLHEFFYKYK